MFKQNCYYKKPCNQDFRRIMNIVVMALVKHSNILAGNFVGLTDRLLCELWSCVSKTPVDISTACDDDNAGASSVALVYSLWFLQHLLGHV